MSDVELREHVTRLVEEAVESVEYLTIIEYAEEYGLAEGDAERIADAFRGVRVQVICDE